eukprot:GGOE01044253.1.p3 GENE.GGOE01044253.1~~GGOE01044253.1.p3  ORF type:complete len:153 (-),score=48.57 GGOE01044253.1:188-646(-)
MRQRHTEREGRPYNETGVVREKDEKPPRSALRRLWDRLVSLCFVLLTIYVVRLADLLQVMLHSDKVFRWVMYTGFLGFAVHVAIGAFLVVYVSWWHGESIETFHSLAIPVAAGAAAAGFVLLTIALWPVYHILTPFLMLLLLWGVINLVCLY